MKNFIKINRALAAKKKKLFTLFCCLMWAATMFAYDVKIGDLYYNLYSNNTAVVTYMSCNYNYEHCNSDWNIQTADIPSSFSYSGETYRVTGIGELAFADCSSLTSVTIPNSVTRIGNYAFDNCTSLTSIEISNGVIIIGERAFRDCAGLTSIEIPNSVISIHDEAFHGCTGLTSIEIPNSVTSIGSYAFQNCTGLTSIVIPNSVTSIGKNAFNECSRLTSVTWNAINCGDFTFDSKVHPTYSPFYGSREQITSFTFGDKVTRIPAYLCYGMSNVTSIAIPNSVTSIGGDVFYGCTALTSIEIPNSVTSIGRYVFYHCTGLTSVTIGNSVTSIGISAFSGCTGLTSIEIPNSVTSIGAEAFNNVLNIVYDGTASGSPWGAKSVNGFAEGWLVYSDNTKTTLQVCSTEATGEITIPNSVTSIGQNAFYGCKKITSVILPNSLTSIGQSAFSDCTGLTSIEINGTSIGDGAFKGCTGLTSVNISSNVKSLSDSAFAYCSKLAEVIIPGSVTSIGKGAFKYGNRLQKIHLGENIETIDTGAFANCPYLLEIHAKMEFPPVIDASVFEDCGDLSGIDCYVPETSMALYKKAIIWKEFQLHPMETVNVNVQASATNGIVEGAGNYEIYTNAVLTVIPNDGYIFKQWSDGNTSNPRTIYVTQDTVLNAVCEPISANALPYNEPFTANIGDFSIKDVNLGGLDYVWKWANTDYGMKASAYVNNTNHATESWLISPAISLLNATDIVLAFDHAVNKGTPDNLRVKISTDSGTSWNDLDVPNWPAGTNWNFISTSLSLDKYAGKIVKIAFVYKSTSSDCPTWEIKNFSVTGTVTPVDPLPIDVEVGETSANVTWQTVSNAYTYELIIRTVNGDVICSIIFDAEGHVQIVTNDSPSRDKASQQEQVDNCVYTITGLTGGTEYNYILIAKDNGGNEIITYSGSFRTKGSSQSIGEISVDSDKPAKILRNGKISILRGDKIYTVTGQEAK